VPETTAATFCATLVDEWVRAGLTDAVVAPGSRSTPMVLALVADGRLRLHVHHDERSAAYVALGLAQATGRPAIVVTTSGTAAVELHPAVVEAHEARIPMVVCTADRPPELHGVGAPQTVDQQQLFGRSVRGFFDAGVPDPAAAGSWRSLAATVVMQAMASPPGPVHLNLPFREPLVGEAATLPPARPGGGAWHRPVVRSIDPPADQSSAATATVRDLVFQGPVVRLAMMAADGHEIIAHIGGDSDLPLLRPGDDVWVSWNPDVSRVLPDADLPPSTSDPAALDLLDDA